ncbi:hypothetical protein [Nocardia tenerifensis]|uniref:hypothetical protein n=1 Tax=Nocardia tenerifensis TaxID=228006 RepID=UPI0011B5C5ED|nr:hypothetical protein [Nocardia tenerifensis]
MSSTATARRTPSWFVLWMGLLTALILLCCLALFWQLAAEGTFPLEVVLWLAIGVLGAVALLFGLVGLLRYRAFFYSLISPVIIGVFVVLVWQNVPETTGWKLSRDILQTQAADCANPGHRTRLGVYTITFITRRDGGCLFYTQGTETNSSRGFAYFPNAAPPYIGTPTSGIGYEPFHGNWYRFTEES